MAIRKYTPLPALDRKSAKRFWQKVKKRRGDGCWEWIGSRTPLGYGTFSLAGRRVYAHRVAYQDANGPVPDGYELDHLCRNPSCLRPDHLEAVTHGENLRRGTAPPAENARRTHCVHGHAFNEANTIVEPGGRRRCRACRDGRSAERIRERREARVAAGNPPRRYVRKAVAA